MKKTKLLFLLFILSMLPVLASCRDWEEVRKALEANSIEGATFVGSETCGTCHEKQVRDFQMATHARVTIPGEGTEIEGCEMCHGPGSKHVDAEGKDGQFIINPDKDPSLCFACHMEKKAEFKLPYHHPVMEGQVSCSDCHDAHGSDARPWSMTSLEGVNEACFKCHKEQRGPFVWHHEALKDGCTACHSVHGSVNDKMLIARDSNLCLRCHTQMRYPVVGDSNHNTRLPEGTCFSAGCHTAVHGSNFDEHLRY